MSVVVFLKFLLDEVAQAWVVTEFEDDVFLCLFVEAIFIALREQPFQLADTGYQVLQLLFLLVFFVSAHVPEPKWRWNFIE